MLSGRYMWEGWHIMRDGDYMEKFADWNHFWDDNHGFFGEIGTI